jgi:hypothetical protein
MRNAYQVSHYTYIIYGISDIDPTITNFDEAKLGPPRIVDNGS